jgi:hypothetical protein
MMSKEEALRLIENSSKCSHSLLVAEVMAELAKVLGENEEEWRLVGLLHDLDCDLTKNDLSKHGIVAAERLKEKLPEDCLYAIKAHDYRTGFKPRSKLDKALIAVDSLASLLKDMAKKREELSVKEFGHLSAHKPWIKRNVLECEKMGLKLEEFLELCLKSVRKIFCE